MNLQAVRQRRAVVAQAKARRMRSRASRRLFGPQVPSDLAYRADLRKIARATWNLVLDDLGLRADADSHGLRFKLYDVVRAKVPAAAKKQAERVSKKGAEDTRRVLGIDPRGEVGVGPMLDAFVIENVSLITSVAEEQHDRVRKLLNDNLGLRHEELADKLEDEFGITSRRAELIARDQTLTLAGDLTRIRQTNAGVDRFVWTTSGDIRVRDEHDDIDGQVFDWATGHPVEGFPGGPILCRCTAYPVVPGFEEEAA